MEKYDENEGKWRTIRGRRVFIREGESLESAMSRSGKFKRSDIKEKRSQARYDEATHKFWDNKSKKSNRQAENKMKRETLEPNKKQQAEKNRINENANIEGSGKTRVQRNWNKYSEEQRREVRHEEIQKKLAEYKAKKQSNNKVEKLVKKGNTYIPIRKGENEEDVVRNYVKTNDKETMKYIKKEQDKEKDLQNGTRHHLGEKGEKEVAEAQKRKGRLYEIKGDYTGMKDRRAIMMKFTANNKELIGKWAQEYDNNENMRKEISRKLANGEKLSLKEYYGVIGSTPREGSVIIAGGENGEDVRVGKNGKLEVLTDDDFDKNNVYVGKREKIQKYKKRKGK